MRARVFPSVTLKESRVFEMQECTETVWNLRFRICNSNGRKLLNVSYILNRAQWCRGNRHREVLY